MTVIKTTLAPGAPWHNTPAKPERRKTLHLDALQIIRDNIARRVNNKREVIMLVIYDANGHIVSMMPPKPASQPARSGLHNYMGRWANVWTEGFRAAEMYHRIGTTPKRTK